MRVFKPTRRAADGKRLPYDKFYAELRTAAGRVMRLPGFENERLTEALGRNVQRLINLRASGETLPEDTTKWIETLPHQTAKVLTRWGLLQGHTLAAGEPLSKHAADWKAAMLGRGLTPLHAMTMHNNALRIFTFCNAKFLTDLQPGKVQTAIAELRKPKAKPAKAGDTPGQPPAMTKGASLQTCNHSIKAVKSFTHWACRDGRMQADPLAHLSKFNARTDRRHDRRALSDDEVNALIAAAETGPTILGIAGPASGELWPRSLSEKREFRPVRG